MPVRNIVLLATPVDMGELGRLTSMLRSGQLSTDDLVDWTGNVPSDRIKESFHLVEPAGEITTYLSLWNSLGHPERLEAHQALVRWSSGHIPFPGAAFRQIVDLFIHDDSLVRGQVPLGTASSTSRTSPSRCCRSPAPATSSCLRPRPIHSACLAPIWRSWSSTQDTQD